MALAEIIREIISNANFAPNDFALTYYNGLGKAEKMYGEKGVRVQALYLYSNLFPENDKQKLALQNLLEIGEGKEISDKLETNNEELNELEQEKISMHFERYTEEKVNCREKIGIDDFREFADKFNYPLNKVLACNPWCSEVLTDEARKATKTAQKFFKCF